MTFKHSQSNALFKDSGYVAWREQRLAALADHLGPNWLQGRTVLELGSGPGDLSTLMIGLGAEHVTAVDFRPDYVAEADGHHGVTGVLSDIDKDDMPAGPFDVVVHVGVLYHLSDPWRSISQACDRTKELLILECEVIDSYDPADLKEIGEDPNKADDGASSIAVRLSPSGVERAIASCGFSSEPVDVPDTESGHRYRWDIEGTRRGGNQLYRRMWVCRPNVAT